MKLFITSSIPEKIYKLLENEFELNYHNSDRSLSEEELIEGAKDADIIFCPLSDKITANVINAGKNLKLVANYGAGFDNIDLEAAKEKNVIVTNAPASNSSTSTAELTAGLIIAAARHIVSGERVLKDGGFYGWKPNYLLGKQLRGKTLGIIGMGNIGQKVAEIFKAFGMEIVYYNRTRLPELEAKNDYKYMEIDEIIKASDVLTIHTAYHKDLHHMIDYKRMKEMKSDAILVNAARGPLVCESDLIKALNEGLFYAVALDVYEFEPKYAKELEQFERVILCPHLGNATFEAREEMGETAVSNILAVKNGKEPKNRVC
ncbi:MAG: NAD(P)-dependent oxidoreductase [Tissierellia bacterium]|nr:NAD(P)-dependent oxidoreductase [Tissierellia bacterium]